MAAMTARQRQTHVSKNSAVNSALPDHQPVQTLVETARTYARDNPEAAALWCFGIGFVLGWKLKLW